MLEVPRYKVCRCDRARIHLCENPMAFEESNFCGYCGNKIQEEPAKVFLGVYFLPPFPDPKRGEVQQAAATRQPVMISIEELKKLLMNVDPQIYFRIDSKK